MILQEVFTYYDRPLEGVIILDGCLYYFMMVTERLDIIYRIQKKQIPKLRKSGLHCLTAEDVFGYVYMSKEVVQILSVAERYETHRHLQGG